MAASRTWHRVGVRDRAANAPITPDTAFRIASMTKSFTALAILKLRDEGQAVAGGSGVEVDPGVRAHGTADARHAAAAHPPAAEPQRGVSRRQSVGRSAIERHRRGTR